MTRTSRHRNSPGSPDSLDIAEPGDQPATGISSEELEAIEQHEREMAERRAPSSSRLERTTALTVTALSIVALIASRNIDVRVDAPGVGPRWWPTMLSSLSLVLSAMLSVITFTRIPDERDGIESASRAGWRRFGITIGIVALFVVAWTTTGNFLVPCLLMLAALLFSYGTRSWKPLVLFPVVSTAVVYLLFHSLLQIPL